VTTTKPHIVIAGSGLAGLHCAVTLSASAEVTVYDRLPVPGGDHWEDHDHRSLTRRALDNGVRFAAGTQVVRWEGDRILAIGEQGGIARADALVVATGHRPSTRAELGINGDRCAGVVPATLALHLLKQQVHLGDNVVVAAGSPWSTECITELTSGPRPSASVVAVGANRPPTHPHVTAMPDARIVATHGMPRIAGVTVESDTGRGQLACDCLILGTAAVPYRNIDGAILDDAPVVYAQRLTDDDEPPGRLGMRAARQALALATNPHHPHIPVIPRIGPPQ
jgi:D-hydroxyproline dehydrogenase subunit alpha